MYKLISLCSVKLDRDRNSVMKKSDIEHMVTTICMVFNILCFHKFCMNMILSDIVCIFS